MTMRPDETRGYRHMRSTLVPFHTSAGGHKAGLEEHSTAGLFITAPDRANRSEGCIAKVAIFLERLNGTVGLHTLREFIEQQTAMHVTKTLKWCTGRLAGKWLSQIPNIRVLQLLEVC